MEFLSRNPFVRILLPLVVGIVIANYFPHIPIPLLGAALLLAIVLWGAHVWVVRTPYFHKYRWLFGCAVFVFLATFGAAITNLQQTKTKVSFLPTRAYYQVKINNPPKEKKNTVLCQVQVLAFADSVQPHAIQGTVWLYIQKDSNSLALQQNDVMWVHTLLKAPKHNNNSEGFDYATYLQRKGIAATAYVPANRWQKMGSKQGFSLTTWAYKCQQHLLEVYKRYGFEGDEYAVLAALSLGYKDALSPEIKERFSTSGAMHVLAVSGLHVGIIFMVLNWLFSLLMRGLRHAALPKAILVLLCLWMYAFVTGLSASVLRATIMFSLVQIGMGLKYRTQIYNTISLSAFVLLVSDPMLLFQVGFQLSYLAVVAIVFYQPKIRQLIYFSFKPACWLWELVSVAIAAQIGTAPLVLYYFNQFSTYFWLTNIWVIPLVTVVLHIVVLLLVVSPFGTIASGVAWLLDKVLVLLNGGIQAIDGFPWAIFTTWVSAWQVWCIFVLIVLLTISKYVKPMYCMQLALVCVIAILVPNVYQKYETIRTQKLIVFADVDQTLIQQTMGKQNTIYTYNTENAVLLTEQYTLKNKLKKPTLVPLDTVGLMGFVFDNRSFLVLDNNSLYAQSTCHRLQTHYLLLGDICNTSLRAALAHIQTSNIIALATFPDNKIQELHDLCNKQQICLYNINEQGTRFMLCNANIKHSGFMSSTN